MEEVSVYCCRCGKMAKCVVNDHMHLIPERAFADCPGPFAYCPPPDEGAVPFPDVMEEPEPEDNTFDNPFLYDDFRFDPTS